MKLVTASTYIKFTDSTGNLIKACFKNPALIIDVVDDSVVLSTKVNSSDGDESSFSVAATDITHIDGVAFAGTVQDLADDILTAMIPASAGTGSFDEAIKDGVVAGNGTATTISQDLAFVKDDVGTLKADTSLIKAAVDTTANNTSAIDQAVQAGNGTLTNIEVLLGSISTQLVTVIARLETIDASIIAHP